MTVVVTGAGGQLGSELLKRAPSRFEVVGLTSSQCDISCEESVARMFEEYRPVQIVNAAAYTAVDRAEDEPTKALAVNATGVGHLASACQSIGAKLIHVSTDFVFDGKSGTPYAVSAKPDPLGVYGQTKLAGEEAAGSSALVVRTSWVYSAIGANFVKTMLRLMADRPEIRVVSDQIGSPTWAGSLASAIWDLGGTGRSGIYHYTDSGVASWYDLAVAVGEEALSAGLLQNAAAVIPIATQDYPTPAARPPYSVLDNSQTWEVLGYRAPHWRVNLRKTIREIKENG